MDFFKVRQALGAGWRAGGADWLASLNVIDEIRQDCMAQSSAESIWTNPGAGSPPQFLGHGLYEATYGVDSFSATTGQETLAVFGNFADAYTVVRRSPTMFRVVENLVDVTNNRPRGADGLYALARIGGDAPILTAAKTLENVLIT